MYSHRGIWRITNALVLCVRFVCSHPVPVDKLLFLRGRATVKHLEKAILLSSEAGVIRWWNISSRPEMGETGRELVF